MYSLALKKWGLYWICPVCLSVILSICHSVILQFYHNSVFVTILRMNEQNFIIFCIHIIVDKIHVGIVNRHFFANLQQSYDP